MSDYSTPSAHVATEELTDLELDAYLAEHLFTETDELLVAARYNLSGTYEGMGRVIAAMRERDWWLDVYTVVPTNMDMPVTRWLMSASFRKLGGSSWHGVSGEEESLRHSLPRAVAKAAQAALSGGAE